MTTPSDSEHAVTIKPRIIGYRRNGCPIWTIQGGSAPVVENPGATPGQHAAAGQQDPPADAPKDGDQALGEGGRKALQAERDARKALEKKVADFEAAQQDQARRLAEALGIKPKDSASSEDVVATLQAQVQQMQRDNLVYQVITDPAHPITDPDDRELIRSAADEPAMRRLATRLSAAATAAGNPGGGAGGTPTGQSWRGPAPDPSQGRGGNTPAKSARQAGIDEAKRRFPNAGASTTT